MRIGASERALESRTLRRGELGKRRETREQVVALQPELVVA